MLLIVVFLLAACSHGYSFTDQDIQRIQNDMKAKYEKQIKEIPVPMPKGGKVTTDAALIRVNDNELTGYVSMELKTGAKADDPVLRWQYNCKAQMDKQNGSIIWQCQGPNQ